MGQPASHNQKDFGKGLRSFRGKQIDRFFVKVREVHMRGERPEALLANGNDDLVQHLDIGVLFSVFG